MGYTRELKRYSRVWRSCSQAFGAWAFHVRERRRLQKVRALASHVRLEPHAVFRPSVYVRPCGCVADRAKVCQGALSSQLVPSCPKLAGGSTHRAERFCGASAGRRNTMATRICGAGEPDPPGVRRSDGVFGRRCKRSSIRASVAWRRLGPMLDRMPGAEPFDSNLNERLALVH